MLAELIQPGDPRRSHLDELQDELTAIETELTAIERGHLPKDEIRARARAALERYLSSRHVADTTFAWLRTPGADQPLLPDDDPAGPLAIAARNAADRLTADVAAMKAATATSAPASTPGSGGAAASMRWSPGSSPRPGPGWR